VKRRVINFHPGHLIVFLAFAFLTTYDQAFGQSLPANSSLELDCRIDRISPQNHTLEVKCIVKLPAKKIQLRFADRFAGVERLSERVYRLKVRDEKGSALEMELHGDGLYSFVVAGVAQPIVISYEIRLARALDPSQFALVSSLGGAAGFLMPADLLPRLCADESGCEDLDWINPAQLMIVAPPEWRIATTEKRLEGFYEIQDLQRAVFFLARMREKTVAAGAMNIQVAIAGDWSFSDEEVFKLAEDIAREQAAIIGSREAGNYLVTLAPFPQPLTGLRSSAVTIGRTTVLMLNPNGDAIATYAHYRRHLAHEMFHFYLPNAFQIRENFDWFWEGFTRYIALLTLARLRLIGLRDYLDAVGAEYDAYWFNPLRNQVSILQASPEKFANGASYDLVYRKGMLVAALYDLELRWLSRGKVNLADLMRRLYQDYGLQGRKIGNRELIDEMSRMGDFSRFIRDDVAGVREIDLSERMKPYGLVMEWNGASNWKVRLTPIKKLSARQKMLLDGLGRD
jgi:predicted metalloprotease with PDZ domain